MSTEQLPIADRRETLRWLRGELRARWGEAAGAFAVGLLAAAAGVTPVYALGVLVDRVRAGAPSSDIVGITVVIAVAAHRRRGHHRGVDLPDRPARRPDPGHAAGGHRRPRHHAARDPPRTRRQGRAHVAGRARRRRGQQGRHRRAADDDGSALLAVLSIAAMAGIDWRLGLAGLVTVPLYVLALRWYLPRSAPGYAVERAAVGERSQLLLESVQGLRTVHAYRLEAPHLDGIDVASARARDVSVTVFGLFTRFVGRVNRAEFVGLAVIVVDRVLAGAGRLGHRRRDRRRGRAVPPAVQPGVDAAVHVRRAAGGRRGLARLVGVVDHPRRPRPAAAGVTVPSGRHARADRRAVRLPRRRRGPARRQPAHRGGAAGRAGRAPPAPASPPSPPSPPGSSSRPPGPRPSAGCRVALMDPAELRSQVAIISQETHVFAGPLIEDLRLARPGTRPTRPSRRPWSTVGAPDWVRALPDGLRHRRRRRRARADRRPGAAARPGPAVLADPAVAVLDEATAEAGSLGARDLEDVRRRRDRGPYDPGGAHRLTQAASADRVVVLEHGRVVEEGRT